MINAYETPWPGLSQRLRAHQRPNSPVLNPGRSLDRASCQATTLPGQFLILWLACRLYLKMKSFQTLFLYRTIVWPQGLDFLSIYKCCFFSFVIVVYLKYIYLFVLIKVWYYLFIMHLYIQLYYKTVNRWSHESLCLNNTIPPPRQNQDKGLLP